MRQRWPAILLLAAALSACDREERETRPEPVAQQEGQAVLSGGLAPGPEPAVSTPADNPDYTENAYQVAEGKRLFSAFNCVGCHSNGGGGMGPPLIDAKWIYGSAPVNIYDTLVEGRPNGMPAFGRRVPEQQLWQLVAYVRSLGGFVPSTAAPGRSDDMNARASKQSLPSQTPAMTGDRPSTVGNR